MVFGIVVYGYDRTMVEHQRGTQSAAEFRPRAVEASPPVGLVLERTTYHAIEDHLRAGLPNEGCGLLATQFRGDGPERVEHFYPGRNRKSSPTAYAMDPGEVVAALKDIDARGWRLGAIVHSHPLTPPAPSETDVRLAYYPGALMVIVSFAQATPEIRAWRLGLDGAIVRLAGEAPIEIVDLSSPSP